MQIAVKIHARCRADRRTTLAVLALLAFGSAVSCGGETASLTEESLRNAKYRGIGIYPDAVRLTDGEFEGYWSAGGSKRSTIVIIEPCAYGDLDGDGVDDAAVLLLENSGSGLFVYLAAVLNQRGRPENVATTLLIDQRQAQVEGLAIEPGRISIRLLTHRPGDPKCCPSEMREVSYALVSGELVP